MRASPSIPSPKLVQFVFSLMLPQGPIAQHGLELPAHNRLVPGSNPGGPIPRLLSNNSHRSFITAAQSGAVAVSRAEISGAATVMDAAIRPAFSGGCFA